MIMVKRDIKAEGYDNNVFFLATCPTRLPSTYIEIILNEKFQLADRFQSLKKKIVAAFIPRYDYIIEAFFQVLFEDGTKKEWVYAFKRQKSCIAPDDSFWKGTKISDEYRPQNRQKEEEVLLQIINELKAKVTPRKKV
jgi:hypothetical protein